jgi:hypothetical protein
MPGMFSPHQSIAIVLVLRMFYRCLLARLQEERPARVQGIHIVPVMPCTVFLHALEIDPHYCSPLYHKIPCTGKVAMLTALAINAQKLQPGLHDIQFLKPGE